MKLPDRFGQPEGGIVPMEHHKTPPLNPIVFLGNTATPEEKGRHAHHPPAFSRLLKIDADFHRTKEMFLRQSGFPALEFKTIQTQALQLITQAQHTTQTSQEQNAKEMKNFELQVSILEQKLDKLHSACIPIHPPAGHQDQILQALADITNRLNTFSDLSNSAAINLIQDRLTTSLGKIDVFMSKPSPPDIGLRTYHQLVSYLATCSDLLDCFHVPPASKPIATIKQTGHPTLYPQPHIPQSYPNSIADLRDFDDIHSNIHDPGSDTSHYSTTSAVNTPPQPSATSSQASNPWQMVEKEHLADLMHRLHDKQQEINFLKFEALKNTEANFQLNCKKKNSEHKENNRKLHDDIDALRSDIKKGDDHLQKMVTARNSLHNEVANLEKKNRDLQGEKNELIKKTSSWMKMLQLVL